ncbi:protein lin-37 homolog [Aplysia californica]|uniref:Protein lin-37 homolog n=1 Tax=Aplysia californica TaxID=6500 RepID=A0ABM0K2W6_APLCA|nr:protein lin-37 homolog [Aplysia californica]
MASKGKQEVNSARIRLDATLQHLVDRKEDGQSQSEGEGSMPLPDSRISASPKKSASKPNRKRKRRDDSGEYDGIGEQQTVIMKLFDRSVDLAQFPESSPLYPVCRAWIHNRPHDKSLGTLADRASSPDVKVKEEERSDSYSDVYELPLPIKSEDGCLYDLRVPEAVPQPDERLNIHADPLSAPPAEHLLLNHMARWKEVRNRWHEASVMNEMQYASSIQVLKEMFERNMADSM